jgi:hypothetical protein
VTKRTAFARAAVVAVLIAVPGTAIAAPGARIAAAPAPPGAGAWKTTGDLKGTFTVTAAGYITGLHATITNRAETSCRTGKVTIPTQLKIFDASGTDAEGAYNEYAAGVNDPGADPVIQPLHVELTLKGRKVKGGVWLVFAAIARESDGQISYTTTGTNGGPCILQFDIKKA